jgi:hypothetical protein
MQSAIHRQDLFCLCGIPQMYNHLYFVINILKFYNLYCKIKEKFLENRLRQRRFQQIVSRFLNQVKNSAWPKELQSVMISHGKWEIRISFAMVTAQSRHNTFSKNGDSSNKLSSVPGQYRMVQKQRPIRVRWQYHSLSEKKFKFLPRQSCLDLQTENHCE